MAAYITQQNSNAIVFNKHVTAIADTGTAMNVTVAGETKPRTYGSVISTIPLTCTRTLNTTSCQLSPMQTNALRELQYGPSIKVGIKFRTQWWLNSFNIIGGQSFTDRSIRTVVYPSYGLPVSSGYTITTVLIASYCWTDDAERLGALINTGEKRFENQLKSIVLKDLADVHGVGLDMITDEFEELYAWDWNHNPLTMGMSFLF
jgi:monoamine oxidase